MVEPTGIEPVTSCLQIGSQQGLTRRFWLWQAKNGVGRERETVGTTPMSTLLGTNSGVVPNGHSEVRADSPSVRTPLASLERGSAIGKLC
jgi:hypothetical protein